MKTTIKYILISILFYMLSYLLIKFSSEGLRWFLALLDVYIIFPIFSLMLFYKFDSNSDSNVISPLILLVTNMLIYSLFMSAGIESIPLLFLLLILIPSIVGILISKIEIYFEKK